MAMAQHVQRLEAGDHQRSLMITGNEFIRLATDNGADMGRANAAVDFTTGVASKGAQQPGAA
jgi:hypothetical protein